MTIERVNINSNCVCPVIVSFCECVCSFIRLDSAMRPLCGMGLPHIDVFGRCWIGGCLLKIGSGGASSFIATVTLFAQKMLTMLLLKDQTQHNHVGHVLEDVLRHRAPRPLDEHADAHQDAVENVLLNLEKSYFTILFQKSAPLEKPWPHK